MMTSTAPGRQKLSASMEPIIYLAVQTAQALRSALERFMRACRLTGRQGRANRGLSAMSTPAADADTKALRRCAAAKGASVRCRFSRGQWPITRTTACTSGFVESVALTFFGRSPRMTPISFSRMTALPRHKSGQLQNRVFSREVFVTHWGKLGYTVRLQAMGSAGS